MPFYIEWTPGRMQTFVVGAATPVEDVWYIPIWPAVLMFGVCYGALVGREAQLARRTRIGRCVACAYSRIGLAPTAPCPECGASAPARS
jgi:hypothetical protein